MHIQYVAIFICQNTQVTCYDYPSMSLSSPLLCTIKERLCLTFCHHYILMSVNGYAECIIMFSCSCPSIWAERPHRNELRCDLCCHVFCGHVWAGPRSNPMVHCGRAVLPGAPPSSHGCGRLLQLDIQLSCRNELPQTGGKQLSCLKTVSVNLDLIIIFVLALPPHNIFRLEYFIFD